MNSTENKKIFVTGATGLVGAHLVERLLELEPAQIVCLCRSQDPSSYFYLKGLDKKVVLAYGDLKDKERIFDIVSKYEITHIFHVAAQAIVPTAYVNPYETLSSNIMGTVHILEAARQSVGIEAVVVASSDKAYGKNCDRAVETNPMAGDHPYDVSKSCTDLVSLSYHKTYGVPVAVSRFGNIFGPGDLNFNRIIPGICHSIIKDQVLELRSDGSFVRDYVYVKDVVDGYISLAENIEKSKGQAFNFSTGYNFSVLDLIKKVSEVLGQQCDYKIINDQKNEIPAQSLDFSKATEVLGWKSKYDFEEGVKETYEWYKGYLK
ncbi:MAG: GDP-mannose 4,6-dehydratase [bacterium]